MLAGNAQTKACQYARAAGLLYLLIIVFGINGEVMVRSPLIQWADAAATSNNILSHSTLLRAGFAADLIMLLCDTALAGLLYWLLKPVNAPLALAAMLFRLLQTAVLAGNLLNFYTALLLLETPVFSTLLDTQQLQAQALLLLQMHSHGYDLGLFFFAVANIFLGLLLLRSRYLPQVFGYGLLAAALVYFTGSTLRFLYPQAAQAFAAAYVIPLLAELGFALWLTFKGVNTGNQPG